MGPKTGCTKDINDRQLLQYSSFFSTYCVRVQLMFWLSFDYWRKIYTRCYPPPRMHIDSQTCLCILSSEQVYPHYKRLWYFTFPAGMLNPWIQWQIFYLKYIFTQKNRMNRNANWKIKRKWQSLIIHRESWGYRLCSVTLRKCSRYGTCTYEQQVYISGNKFLTLESHTLYGYIPGYRSTIKASTDTIGEWCFIANIKSSRVWNFKIY